MRYLINYEKMSKKLTPEDVAKEIDDFQLKHYGYLLRDYPEPFDDEYTSEATSEDEPLPPETRISATPIGNSGFINLINLDELPRPPSPPLQEPRPYYSSDSDSDELQDYTKKPYRPPSRIAEDIIYRRPVYPIPKIHPPKRKYNIESPNSPITITPIAPLYNETDLRKQIQNLQTENQRLKNLLLVSMK